MPSGQRDTLVEGFLNKSRLGARRDAQTPRELAAASWRDRERFVLDEIERNRETRAPAERLIRRSGICNNMLSGERPSVLTRGKNGPNAAITKGLHYPLRSQDHGQTSIFSRDTQ